MPGPASSRARVPITLIPILLTAVAVGVACAEPPPSTTKTAASSETASSETASSETASSETASSETVVTKIAAKTPAEVVAELHHGVDVSGHSGTVDWEEVRAGGHTFAFVKATEGVDLEDPAFDDHWPRLQETGLVRGAYHFYVTEDDPEAQARFFIDNVVLEPGDLAPVVDVELIGHDTPPGLADRLRSFLEILEGHYGVEPIIYTSPKFWNTHLGEGFGDHPLWVAEYGVEEPAVPAGWEEWHLWQWQGDAEVPGVEKGADLSRVNRSGVDLSALVIPESEPSPPTPLPAGGATAPSPPPPRERGAPSRP